MKYEPKKKEIHFISFSYTHGLTDTVETQMYSWNVWSLRNLPHKEEPFDRELELCSKVLKEALLLLTDNVVFLLLLVGVKTWVKNGTNGTKNVQKECKGTQNVPGNKNVQGNKKCAREQKMFLSVKMKFLEIQCTKDTIPMYSRVRRNSIDKFAYISGKKVAYLN